MKKYTVISNISYALKNIWRWDKKFYLFFIPAIPMAVLMPLAASYFPKVLIDSIESGKSIRNIIFIINSRKLRDSMSASRTFAKIIHFTQHKFVLRNKAKSSSLVQSPTAVNIPHTTISLHGKQFCYL